MTELAQTRELSPLEQLADQPVEREYLLDDDAVLEFVARGYLQIDTQTSPALLAEIDSKLSSLTNNPGDGVLDAVPEIREIYAHPAVRGALVSLLGDDMQMHTHRHCHTRKPQPFSHLWHTDCEPNDRGRTELRVLLAMCYPHDVDLSMGPTVIVPGTHLRSAPNPMFATYGNIRGQMPVICKAGTVTFTHTNIWHGVGPNRSPRDRHMLKFLFRRTSDPTSPSWRHTPESADERADKLLREQTTPQCAADARGLLALRTKMWNYLRGE